MTTNLKVRLFKGKTHADGTHPIQLQFYMNGKVKRKGIYACHAEDWDPKASRVKSKVKNSSYINNLISEKYTEYERELIKILNSNESHTNFFDEKKTLTLAYVLEQECIRFQNEKKPGAFKIANCYKSEIANFCDSDKININEVDVKWFQKYVAYIRSEIKEKGEVIKKANMASTAQKKVKTVRRIIERYSGKGASKEIKEFKVLTRKPIKQKLTSDELSRVEALEFKDGSLLGCVRDMFLLQIYLRGARIGSLLQAYSSQFENGRYEAFNNDGKNNVGSKLIPKAKAIVDKYAGKHERLFPLFEFTYNQKASEFENKMAALNKKKSCTTLINKYLKIIAIKADIQKPLSSHIARHTFASMAIKKINNPMVTMELLGHSSLAVHQIYLNDIRRDDVLDAAADDIFS